MNTKALRQKILDLAIHGKLVPQDPNDEPASVLLERIRDEKERLIKEGKIKRPKKSKATSDKPHYENVPFEVPDGWCWCNITDVTNKITDGTHNSPINNLKGDYKYITAKNIKPQGVVLDNISYVSKDIHDEIYARCNPEKGDILYIKDGATTGVVTINNLDEPFSLLSSVALIKPSKHIFNKYLLYYLQSSLCYESVRESMKGVGITRITLKQIEKWVLPLPPIKEQNRIINEIDRWFYLLNIIENGKINLQTCIKETKSKILDLAIHGKLVPQDPTDEPAAELLKRINPKAGTTSDNGHYQKLPEGWCETTLKHVLTIKSGNSINVRNCTQGLYPIYGGNGITGHTDDYNIKESTIVIGRVGYYCGSVYLVRGKAWVSDNAFITTIHKDIFYKKYLYYLLQFLNLRKFSNSTAQPVISGKTIYPIHVLIPPIREQKRIVAKIEEIFAHLNAIEASL